jgi:hypothetical protein
MFINPNIWLLLPVFLDWPSVFSNVYYLTLPTNINENLKTCLKDSDYPFGIFKLFLKEIIHNAFYFEMVVNVASL